MKHFLATLFLALSPTLACFAQDFQDPLEKQPPKWIVQTGIGMQLLGENSEFFTLSVERPLDNFWHVGIQGSHIFPKRLDNSFDFSGILYDRFLGGFEVGGFGKYFLHGKHSGQKSAIYFGAEIRLGTVRSEGQFFGDFTPGVYHFKTARHTQKYLVRWGAQWRFGRHALLEIALPLGWQDSKFVSIQTVNEVESPPTTANGGRFIMLPVAQLGFAF